ncbi:hypothetical protein Q1695_000483 [Nippostrongylus brasiliensis]|nr:hypothetical protein Q1695_000483 [Nippostrongylus brasiliensis]
MRYTCRPKLPSKVWSRIFKSRSLIGIPVTSLRDCHLKKVCWCSTNSVGFCEGDEYHGISCHASTTSCKVSTLTILRADLVPKKAIAKERLAFLFVSASSQVVRRNGGKTK